MQAGGLTQTTLLNTSDSRTVTAVDGMDDDAEQRTRTQESLARSGLSTRGLLGSGGMGAVFLAEQSHLNRDVAVKVLHDRSEQKLQNFNREMRLTARLEHPGVPPVHDGGDDYLIMRMIDGRTMNEAWKDPAVSLIEKVRMLRSVAETIGYAHDHGVIHRDLKPSNVMIGQHGEVQVLDWGLAIELTPLPEEQGEPSKQGEEGSKERTTKKQHKTSRRPASNAAFWSCRPVTNQSLCRNSLVYRARSSPRSP